MTRFRSFAATTALIALLAGGLSLVAPEPASAAPQDDVVSLTNANRANAGLPPLAREAGLDAMAQQWATYMATQKSMVHSSNEWRISQATGGWSLCCGENIAYGYTSASSVVSAWINSPGHRANMLDSRYTHMGAGYNSVGHYWVQVFATYPSAPPTPSVTGPTPTVSGTAAVGGTLTANPGTWSPGSIRLAYQWFADGRAVSGATGRSYAVTSYDMGKRFSVSVTGSAAAYIGGSRTSAVTGTVPTRLPVERIAGQTRLSGAIDVSKRAYPSGANVVYVATAWNFPDAISASAAATHAGGPLLLTDAGSLPSVVSAEIDRLNPTSIVVVGGEGSVSSAVVAQLNSLAPTKRVDGSTRYDVSMALARSAFSGGSGVAYVATGDNFPDAVSASSSAAQENAPILLVPSGKDASAALVQTLRDLKVRTVKIAGGTASVAGSLEASLRYAGFTAQRLGGADRYAANQTINRSAFAYSDHAFIATGENYPDALYGSAWAGVRGDPLFISTKGCVPRGVIDALGAMGVTRVTVLGGESSLTSSVARLSGCSA